MDQVAPFNILWSESKPAPYLTLSHKNSNPLALGTLDILLPSIGTSANLVVSCGKQRKVFSTATMLTFDTSALAWVSKSPNKHHSYIANNTQFSDATCTQETPFQQPTAVLRYFIIRGPGPICSAATTEKTLSRLRAILTSWEKQVRWGEEKCMGFLLECEYGSQKLSNQNLKGKNYLVVSHLKEACMDTDFYVCLTNIERKVEGHSDGSNDTSHWMENTESDSIEVKKLVDLNGKEPFIGLLAALMRSVLSKKSPLRMLNPIEKTTTAIMAIWNTIILDQ